MKTIFGITFWINPFYCTSVINGWWINKQIFSRILKKAFNKSTGVISKTTKILCGPFSVKTEGFNGTVTVFVDKENKFLDTEFESSSEYDQEIEEQILDYLDKNWETLTS